MKTRLLYVYQGRPKTRAAMCCECGIRPAEVGKLCRSCLREDLVPRLDLAVAIATADPYALAKGQGSV